MGNSQRGMDKKSILLCPYCQSKKVVKNGHPHSRKLEFSCKTCHKYFYEDTLKGYPPTSIPFPVIAYILYFRQKVPEFSNMRKFRKFINHWLQHLKISDQGVSRQTIHHWIKNYEKDFERIITFSESREYCRQHLSKITKAFPIPPQKPIPYGKALKILERKFGKSYCINLIRTDEEFFKELVEIISKHNVFCWEFLDKNYLNRSGSQYPLPME